MSHLPVLIVGAGPSGLMMACALARHNISFRIIDKKSEPTKGSNATWIQTRTLEILEIMGMVDGFLKRGHICEGINFYAQGEHLFTFPLKQVDSNYPFILMLPQRETEHLLQNKLEKSHIEVERATELIDIQKIRDGVHSTVRRSNGELEEIKSDWVIACDGANSVVRQKCHLAFSGEDLSEQFMVADAKMSSYLPTNEIHIFFDKGTVFPEKGTLFSAFPWGENNYRLSANLYLSHPRITFTAQEVKEVVADRTYGNYIVESVNWITPFWIHGRMVNELCSDRIFLVGDAAHIHSPVGGQGMNTGLQDAFNLAWKLALVIQGKAQPLLLDTYSIERSPVIKNIVEKTEFFTKKMLFDQTFLGQLKKWGHLIAEEPPLLKKASNELTQVSLSYEKSPIIDYQMELNKEAPLPGERAPNVIMGDKMALYHYFSVTAHTILIFIPSEAEGHDLKAIHPFKKQIEERFPGLLNVITICKENIVGIEGGIVDKSGKIYEHYHVAGWAVYIIRPDNYIAYYSEKITPLQIEHFFNHYLI